MWDYEAQSCTCMSGQRGKKTTANKKKAKTLLIEEDSGRAIIKGGRRFRHKMKEIKLTDRTDITFNSYLIFSVPQLSGGSRDDQISEEGSQPWLSLGIFLFSSAKKKKRTWTRRGVVDSDKVEFSLWQPVCGCRATTQQLKIRNSPSRMVNRPPPPTPTPTPPACQAQPWFYCFQMEVQREWFYSFHPNFVAMPKNKFLKSLGFNT